MIVKARSALDRARDMWHRTTVVRSSYRYAKTWLGGDLFCHCVFPEIPMTPTTFGFKCFNDNCKDYVSKVDAKTCERVKLDTRSVLGHMRSSSMMRALKKADKTGDYLEAHKRD
jgi:hypothetical protein